jgi:dynamin 1-like protein
MFEVIEVLLHKCLSQTDQMIKNLIEIELGFINTSHPDFVSGMDLIQKEERHH